MSEQQRYYTRMDGLQDELTRAVDINDAAQEIATLMEIGELALTEGDFALANMHLSQAGHTILKSGVLLDKLQEVLGAQALLMRRRKRYAQSLDLYREAADSARQYAGKAEVARWTSRQGALHRLMKQPEMARSAFQNAREVYAGLGDDGRAGVADQEGNLGLLAADAGNDRIASSAYRRAVELATNAGSLDLVATWAANLGNACVRQRRYSEAWRAFEQSMEAAVQIGDESSMRTTATQWAGGYQYAHKHRQAAEILLLTAKRITHPSMRRRLLGDSLASLFVAGQYKRLLDIGSELIAVDSPNGLDKKRLDHVQQYMEAAREKLKVRSIDTASLPATPTILDAYLPNRMAEFVSNDDANGMREMAHLICDINLCLVDSSEKSWQPLLTETHLRYRVLGEAMVELCKNERVEQSFEISQRFKSIGFCAPNIMRLKETDTLIPEAIEYLARLNKLSEAVKRLQVSAFIPDGLQRVEAVREAGELLLEAGVKLHERDPILHARLGGVIPVQDLIEALPLADPAAIVDLVLTGQGMLLHILRRLDEKVCVLPILAENFTFEHAKHLMHVWAQTGIVHDEMSESGEVGIAEISRVLHDQLFCKLAKQLNELLIPQIILIPDTFTRHLPLHLAGVCGENLQDLVEHINIHGMSADIEYFSEVFPTEYAPCVQAIAVSQHQKRPREVSNVLSLANPISDLPGAQSTAGWLQDQLPDTLAFISYVGEAATLENLFTGIEDADVVVIGTHGKFDTENALMSHLTFSDGHWTMADMLDDKPFRHSPVLILSACEIGAIGITLNELEASGIPGALISTGAACVLANMWPVEPVSMGYIVERFVTHLSHAGYRPSAALLRAVRDLRLLSKADALKRCDAQMLQVKHNGATDNFFRLYNLRNRIKASENNHPFSAPQWWAATIIVGSGWARPAGGIVVPIEDMLDIVEDALARENAQSLLATGQVSEARNTLEKILVHSEGIERARTLDALAWAVWLERQEGAEQAAKHEAQALLDSAAFVAQAEQDEQMIRNIKATRQKIELWEE